MENPIYETTQTDRRPSRHPVLIGFGLGAMIFAFIDTPFAHKALTVCLYCAITVPVLIYAMMLVAKVLSHRDENDKSDKGEKQS